MESVKTLIIGAGVSGLSTAAALGDRGDRDVLVLEADSEIGGFCKTVVKDGFVWDYSGHFFHFKHKDIEQYLVERMKGQNIRTVGKKSFIHYKGNAQNFIDLTAGRVQVSPMSLFAALPFIKAGKVRPIAQLSLQRSAFLPDLPTVAEQGVPGFDYFTWQGFILPAGTPPGIIAKLYAPLAAHARNPEAIARAARDGSELIGSPPETMLAALAGLRHEHGSIENYLLDGGLRPDSLAHLRDTLIQRG